MSPRKIVFISYLSPPSFTGLFGGFSCFLLQPYHGFGPGPVPHLDNCPCRRYCREGGGDRSGPRRHRSGLCRQKRLPGKRRLCSLWQSISAQSWQNTTSRSFSPEKTTGLWRKTAIPRLPWKRRDLEARTQIANQAKADVFLSIHANSFPEPIWSGSQTFSQLLARQQSWLNPSRILL